MLILDKDKTTIVNTDTMLYLCASNAPFGLEDGYRDILVSISADENAITLGEYKEERAFEIIAEIMKKAEVGARTYELPRE